MAKQVQFRRGTTTDHDGSGGTGGFTGANGEVTVDTGSSNPSAGRSTSGSDYTLRVHDGSTQGGHKLATQGDLDKVVSLNDPATSTVDSTAITEVQGGVRYTENGVWKYAELEDVVSATAKTTTNTFDNSLFQILFNSYGTGKFLKPVNELVAIGNQAGPTTAGNKITCTGGTITLNSPATNETWQILAIKTDSGNTSIDSSSVTTDVAINFAQVSSSSPTLAHGLTNCVWLAIRIA